MHGAILTAMDKMVTPGVEMTLKSYTGSSGQGPKSEVQRPDRSASFGNAGSTALMSASSQLNLNTNQDSNDETCNEGNFEDGNFPASTPSYERRAQAEQMVT